MHKIIVLPDAHVPYHDKKATNLAKNVCAEIEPDVIVFIGDWVDCYSVSQYPKDPGRVKRLKDELEEAAFELHKFRVHCNEVFFTEGNHETRLSRFIAAKVPELYGLISVREHLGLGPAEWIPYREIKRIGKCHFTHEVGYCGKNASQQSLDAFGGNLVFGHTHRAGVIYDGNMRNEHHFCMNVGWLGDAGKIDYAHKPRVKGWQHGVGLVVQDDRGVSQAQFLPFVNKSCVVNNKVVKL